MIYRIFLKQIQLTWTASPEYFLHKVKTPSRGINSKQFYSTYLFSCQHSFFFVPTQQYFLLNWMKENLCKKVHWTLRDNFLWTIVKIFFRQIIDKIILKLGRRSKLLLQDLLLILEFSTYVVTSAGLVNNLTNKRLFFPSDDGLKMYGFEFGT